MQIALFGGTFDPPHRGHLVIAEQLLKKKVVDEVWFVPVKNHPFLRKMSSAVQRVKMLEMMTLGLHDVQIERFELDQASVSYSLKTLQALAQQYPQHTFSWVIGSDNLKNFDKWHEFAALLKQFVVYVYPRQGFSAQPLHEGMVFLKNFPEINISSTEVRQKIDNKEDISGLVEPSVEKYIRELGLYQHQV